MNEDLFDTIKKILKFNLFTVSYKYGAHVLTESIGEIHASPSPTPCKLIFILPASIS